jgi:hypothetical protein
MEKRHGRKKKMIKRVQKGGNFKLREGDFFREMEREIHTLIILNSKKKERNKTSKKR